MALCQVFSLEGGGIALCSGLSPSLLSPTGNPVGSAFQHSPVLTASHHPTFSPSCSLLVGCHESLYTVLLLLSPPLCPVCSPWILGDRFTGKLSRGQMVPRSAHRCLTTSHRSQSNSKSPSALPDRRPLHVPPPPATRLGPTSSCSTVGLPAQATLVIFSPFNPASTFLSGDHCVPLLFPGMLFLGHKHGLYFLPLPSGVS